MSTLPTLGYWAIRGRAEPIRNLLRYAGVPFNDKRYQCGPGKGFADLKSIMGPWLPDRRSLPLDFPNLPYYMEGDLKLTQSITILRYLGRKHGLIATTDPELARQELAEQQIMDIAMKLFMELWTRPDYKEKTPEFIKNTLSPQLEAYAKFLGSGEWITSKISYVDFLVYETLDWIRLFTPETMAKFPTLANYLLRFESLKPIKEYRNSKDFKSCPLFSPLIEWGST